MKKWRLKTRVDVETITFEEFVAHGLAQKGANINRGVPWSFIYAGYHVTHENDDRYLILNVPGSFASLDFRRGQLLGINDQGGLFVTTPEKHAEKYEEIEI